MSLLLDALKRAEQEKLARQGDGAAPAHAHAPAPQGAAPASMGSTASAATLELQPINAASAGPTPVPSGGTPRTDAQTAQTVFQAKELPAGEPNRKMTIVWVAAAVVVLAIVIAGGYVWWQVQSFKPATVTTLRPRPAPVAAPASGNIPDTQPKLDLVLPPTTGRVDPSATATNPAKAPPPPSAPVAAPPRAVTPAPEPLTPGVSASPQQLVENLMRAPPRAAEPLRLEAGSEKPRIAPDVAIAYQALRNGDLGMARRSYAAALAADPQNLDALLGLATVEARSGNRMMAASNYRRALEIDPRSATALAGMAALGDFAQPEGVEAQLRADLARTPQSPALHFTLGNLFATQSRWSEAQVEYFEAYRLDPSSADYLFNLAVSLDHLGQARLAAENYRRALDMARSQGAQFDPAPVVRRLAELGGAR